MATDSAAIKHVVLQNESSPLLLHESERKGCVESLRSSWKAIFLELRGPQRLWTTLVAALLTSMSPLLGGYTLGFASPALLQLNDPGVPVKYHLRGLSLAMFAVSVQCCMLFMIIIMTAIMYFIA